MAKMSWITRQIRQTTVSAKVKRKARQHADKAYDRLRNPVMWFDIWEAYVYGSKGW